MSASMPYEIKRNLKYQIKCSIDDWNLHLLVLSVFRRLAELANWLLDKLANMFIISGLDPVKYFMLNR